MFHHNPVPVFKTASPTIVALLVILAWMNSATAAIKYAGVNLSCAEFGQNNLPGTYNTHYTDVF